MRSFKFIVAAVAAMPGLSFAGSVQGQSSSATPYLTPVGAGVNVYSIFTVGDSVNTKPDGTTPYRMVGIPDGLGAFSNGNGSMTLLMNHEIDNGSGVARAHGVAGAFVSQWNISTAAGVNFLKVNNGQDLDTSYVGDSVTGGGVFKRFCSADLPSANAFYNPATGRGTTDRLYMNGEEVTNGTVIAHDVNTRTGYVLPAFGSGGSWENLLAHPNLGDKTLVMGNSDGGGSGNANTVSAYLGTKNSTGATPVDRAGLTNGTQYRIQVSVGGAPVTGETRANALGATSPVYAGDFSLTTTAAGGTVFSRPEDGAWDPVHPNDYYFVTTDQLDTRRDGLGTADGRSRLWRMRYADVNNPTLGGTIEALMDGTEGQNMLDNIALVPGTDGDTRIIALEDVGNAAHNGKVMMYDVGTDTLTTLLQHDQARFGDVSVNATSPFTQDEESSGVIDARDTLGLGWFLIDVQAHYGNGTELVEGGQLLAFYAPQAVPEPASLGLLTAGGVTLLRRRRR